MKCDTPVVAANIVNVFTRIAGVIDSEYDGSDVFLHTVQNTDRPAVFVKRAAPNDAAIGHLCHPEAHDQTSKRVTALFLSFEPSFFCFIFLFNTKGNCWPNEFEGAKLFHFVLHHISQQRRGYALVVSIILQIVIPAK